MIISRVFQKSIGKRPDGKLHGIAQSIPDARTGFQGVLMVFFNQAVAAQFFFYRHPADMQQPVHDGEIRKMLLIHHGLQVKLD